MSSPPSLPQLPWSSKEWEQCRRAWQAAEQELPTRRLQQRHRLLRPLLQEALRSLATRHDLLFDNASLHFDAILHLGERPSLPEQQMVCQIHLESIFLKLIKHDERARLSDLRDPMTPWHALRLRVNEERRSFRHYFLAFLPRFENSTAVERKPARKPNQHWAKLWERLTVDIPAGCIPSSWHAVRELVPDEVIEVETDYGNRLFLPPKRDWKELLARPLFQAAALVESRRPGLQRFSAASGTIPENVPEFVAAIRQILQRTGGIPQSDSDLQEALEQILALPNGSAKHIDPMLMSTVAQRLGHSSFEAILQKSSILGRKGETRQAIWQAYSGLQHAQGPKEIAIALANISAHHIIRDDASLAIEKAKEAIVYNPFSSMSRANLNSAIALSRLLDHHGDRDHG